MFGTGQRLFASCLADSSVDDIPRLRDHRVRASFAGDLRWLGQPDLDADDLITLRIHIVAVALIATADAGGRMHSIDEPVALRIGG